MLATRVCFSDSLLQCPNAESPSIKILQLFELCQDDNWGGLPMLCVRQQLFRPYALTYLDEPTEKLSEPKGVRFEKLNRGERDGNQIVL